MEFLKKPYGVVFLVTIFLLRALSEPTAFAAYCLVSIFCLLGPKEAIQGLILSWIFTMLNPGIVADVSNASVGRYIILLFAAISAYWHLSERKNFKVSLSILTISVIGVFFVIHAIIFSPILEVSILKALSWTIAMATVVSAWQSTVELERIKLSRWIFNVLLMVMLASLPFLFLPQGYLVNGTGFQGILNHPQAFGPTMALLATWSSVKFLEEKKHSWTNAVVTVICIALILASEARTAGLSFVLGMTSAIFLWFMFKVNSLNPSAQGFRAKRVYQLLLVLALLSILAGPFLFDRFGSYISKRGEVNALTDAYENSRGFLIDQMLENIKRDPWEGVGFGIASDPTTMNIKRDPLLNLPIGASIEKGVMPLAILEEVGVVGFIIILGWLIFCLRRAASGGMAPLALSMVALFLNMGESTFFSPGGYGLLPMIIMGWAFTFKRTIKNL